MLGSWFGGDVEVQWLVGSGWREGDRKVRVFTCFLPVFICCLPEFLPVPFDAVFLCFGLFSAVPLTAYLVGLRHKELCKLMCSIFQVLVSLRRDGGLLKVAFPLPVVTDKKSHIFLLYNARPQHIHVHVLGLVTRSREARI